MRSINIWVPRTDGSIQKTCNTQCGVILYSCSCSLCFSSKFIWKVVFTWKIGSEAAASSWRQLLFCIHIVVVIQGPSLWRLYDISLKWVSSTVSWSVSLCNWNSSSPLTVFDAIKYIDGKGRGHNFISKEGELYTNPGHTPLSLFWVTAKHLWLTDAFAWQSCHQPPCQPYRLWLSSLTEGLFP